MTIYINATPYQSGYAYGKCGSVAPCPYARGTDEYREWQNGYDAGSRARGRRPSGTFSRW